MRRGLGLAESPASTRGGGKKIARTPDIRTERGLCSKCGAWQGVLGNEPTVELYVSHMVEVCREIRRVLRSDGTFWLNLGDSYAASSTSNHGRGKATPALNGHGKGQQLGGWENPPRHFAPGFKPKDLMLVPHRVAIALQNDGWWVRMDNVWAKLNCLPESVEDRPTKSHEYIFLLTKSTDYFYDAEAVRERQTGTAHSRGNGVTPKSIPHDGLIRANESFHAATSQYHAAPDGNRNLRSVWSMASEPYREAHFACVDEETEALTPSGWRTHDELADGDVIAAYGDDGLLHWQTATFHRYEYHADMVVIEKRDTSQWLTPNHRCLVERRQGRRDVIRADALRPDMQVPLNRPLLYDTNH
jgi:hypothetical protein